MLRRVLLPLLLTIGAVLALVWIDHSLLPRLDEPLPLRWLRAAAEHPLRTWMALAALLWPADPRPDGSRGSGVQERGASGLQ